MFIIYEEIFRYVGNYSRSTILGYVNTEDEARYTCYKLNKSVQGKNELNSMGQWRYYFERIDKFMSMDNVDTEEVEVLEDEENNLEDLDL